MSDDTRIQWARYWEAVAGLMQGDFAHGQRKVPKEIRHGTFAHGMRALPAPCIKSKWNRDAR